MGFLQAPRWRVGYFFQPYAKRVDFSSLLDAHQNGCPSAPLFTHRFAPAGLAVVARLSQWPIRGTPGNGLPLATLLTVRDYPCIHSGKAKLAESISYDH
jgi:hypothetical protein